MAVPRVPTALAVLGVVRTELRPICLICTVCSMYFMNVSVYITCIHLSHIIVNVLKKNLDSTGVVETKIETQLEAGGG